MALRLSNGHELEPEKPGTIGANLQVGSRLFAAAVSFMFLSFAFAYFYLRAVNSNGDFRPHHTNPPQGYGIALTVCVIAAAVVFDLGRRRLVDGSERGWRLAAGAAIGLMFAAVALQFIEYFDLGFGPTNGGYASVFVGWSGLFMVVLLGAIYWAETLLAQSVRNEPQTTHDIPVPSQLLRPAANACLLFLYLLAGVGLATYIILYVV